MRSRRLVTMESRLLFPGLFAEGLQLHCAHAVDELVDLPLRLAELFLAELRELEALFRQRDRPFEGEIARLELAGDLFEAREGLLKGW